MAHQDTENKIIGNLLRKPLESKSMHQLAKETTLSYITVHTIVPTLVKRKIVNLEKSKAKTGTVEEGEEFGMMLESKIEIVGGDIIESFAITQK